MEFYVKNDLSTKQYRNFIQYAVNHSDSFSFFIPHKEIISPEELLFNEEELQNNEDCIYPKKIDYLDYYSYVRSFIEIIQTNILSHSHGFSYLGYKYGYLCEVFVCSIAGDNVTHFFDKMDRLFEWHYPDAPEDPCFFRAQHCWARLVAHENRLFLDIPPEETKTLKKIGLKLKPERA